ncbi:hypothetical protein BDY24DRAFT_418969 [Mrakia frigida]|uniref:uncharacterized protein n=1 Tax=Mrakia frigida TaxID=29902 RepID=UPI003FCC11D6
MLIRSYLHLQALAPLSRRTSLRLPGAAAARPHPQLRSTSSLPPPPPLLLSSSAIEASDATSGTPWGVLAAGLVGFPIVLWTYKCLMLVIFQRRIIYMGYLPPLARTTKIDPSDRLLRGLSLEEIEIESEKGITLRGISLRTTTTTTTTTTKPPRICLVYFQGNLGSPLSRLPLFTHLLLSKLSPFSSSNTILLAVPPRSYYLSTNSPPSQPSLLVDYLSVLRYARTTYPSPETKLVLYAHSLGGAAACVLLGSLNKDSPEPDLDLQAGGKLVLDALVLENPFPSVPIMIEESLYPSKVLPYHYLTGLVLDRWDALRALKGEGDGGKKIQSALEETNVLFVSGERDSLVKPELVRRMFEAAGRGRGRREWLSIKERSHDDTWMAKGDWGAGVRAFLERSRVLEVGVEGKKEKEKETKKKKSKSSPIKSRSR